MNHCPRCKRLWELSPRDAELHSNQGITLQKLGKLDEAEEGFKRAIELEPDYAETYRSLGNTLKELGKIGRS